MLFPRLICRRQQLIRKIYTHRRITGCAFFITLCLIRGCTAGHGTWNDLYVYFCIIRFKIKYMVIPFIALVLVIVIVIVFLTSQAKKTDKGNRPE